MYPIKVLLVEDHAVMRQGLKALLAEEADLAVVGEAAHGREAIALVATLAIQDHYRICRAQLEDPRHRLWLLANFRGPSRSRGPRYQHKETSLS